MDNEEKQRRRNTRTVFLVFALTVVVAVITIGVFMMEMMAKSWK